MSSPWVIEELRAHPNRIIGLQVLGLLSFTLTFVLNMPASSYTTFVYPSASPRVTSFTPNKSVGSRQVGVSKRVMGKLSEAAGGTAPVPLPRRPVPSASPVASPSGPSETPAAPSVAPSEPPAPSQTPSDLGPPSNEPHSSGEPVPTTSKPAMSVVPIPTK
jgi:hypothetical protein